MLGIYQEILHLAGQYMVGLLTLAQLLIFVAMARILRGKRALWRYIAAVLQLLVINGIAWHSAFYGFIAFVAVYALSFVWFYKSTHNMLDDMETEENATSAESESGDGTARVDESAGTDGSADVDETGAVETTDSAVDSIDSAEKY